MKIKTILVVALISGCGQVTYRNVKDPTRDLAADRAHCENTRASSLGVTHCLRRLGWDAQIGGEK